MRPGRGGRAGATGTDRLSELVLGTVARLQAECAAPDGGQARVTLRAVHFSVPYDPGPAPALAPPEIMSLEEARAYFRAHDLHVALGRRAVASAPPGRIARLELTIRLQARRRKDGEMVDLAEFLGTVLRNVTHARVIGDLFSRDVSLQYQKDPLLVDFPVPRLEIKEASVQLRFAVNAIERRQAAPAELAAPIVREQAARLADEIRREWIAASPEREAILKLLAEKGVDPDKQWPAAIERAALEPKALEAALAGRPAALVRNIRAALNALLLADAALRKLLARRAGVQALREQVRTKATAMAERLVAEVLAAREAFARQALTVDVAVTRKELGEVPEALLSQITVVAEIRNYEWSETGEAEGKPLGRLRPA